MRKALTALLLGATFALTAAPALAADEDKSAQQLGDRLRDRVIEDRARDAERRERREERREERQERREERRDDRRDRWEDRRDGWRDRRDNHWDDRRGYDYRYYGGSTWNRQWTPYGFGYHDSFTRDWVLRNFADRNNNGRVSEKEWRRGQTAFYRLADRNYDGYISRYEYDWALRMLRREYGHRW